MKRLFNIRTISGSISKEMVATIGYVLWLLVGATVWEFFGVGDWPVNETAKQFAQALAPFIYPIIIGILRKYFTKEPIA